MERQIVERRLTTILSADVVGYSTLMRRDEAGTVAALKKNRRELFDPKASQYHGRTIKLMGDGALMEFGSVVDALLFAIEVQCAMRAQNADVPDDQMIVYRVGINIGDIIVEGEDIYGDGVNIAARLEGLAEPGGICISRTVFNHVRGKVDLTFDAMGEHQVKNIPEPVMAYRAVLDEKADALVTPVAFASAGYRLTRRLQLAALLIAVAAGSAGLLWWQPWAPDYAPASIARMAFPLPDKPSIAVLPFDNMSEDADHEYFADGMTEDLITDLSKIPELFVIARNSVFTYKGRVVPIHQVAEELGVRYVLEGSVRRAGAQVRINAQLIDATTGGHLWADRYDGSMEDVFGLQDEVTRHVVAALAIELAPTSRAQPQTDNAEAYDAFLRGWAYFRRGSPEGYAKAVPHFEKAIDLDPSYNRAYAAMAALYWIVTDKGQATGLSDWWTSLGIIPGDAILLEEKYLKEAMKDPVVLAYRVASGRLSRRGQHDRAIAEAERAIALDPNDPVAHEAMANALAYAGRSAEAADSARTAMRLDPQLAHDYLYWLGLAQFGMERYEDAVQTLTIAAQKTPDDDRSLIVLIAAYGHLGRVQEATSALEKANALRLERKKHLEDRVVMQRLQEVGIVVGVDVFLPGPYTLKDVDLWPFKEEKDRARLREGLRLAGLPEVGAAENVSPLQVPGATTVDAAAARELFDRGAVFVDVRGYNRWTDGRIPGAIPLDFRGEFTEAALSERVTKDKEVVIYCMGPRCLRSSKACAMAIDWGFEKVYYLREGYPGWKAAGYPVEVGR